MTSLPDYLRAAHFINDQKISTFLKNPANLLMHEERVPDVESVGVEFEESKQGFDTHPQQSFED